jgi:hypothetical protein
MLIRVHRLSGGATLALHLFSLRWHGFQWERGHMRGLPMPDSNQNLRLIVMMNNVMLPRAAQHTWLVNAMQRPQP